MKQSNLTNRSKPKSMVKTRSNNKIIGSEKEELNLN